MVVRLNWDPVLPESKIQNPKSKIPSVDLQQLKFARSHEWVALNGHEATIGISEFAVKELTDLVFIQLPAVGRRFKQGESFGEVESVKAVSDLYAPCAGEIIAVNSKLVDDLGPLSSDPFGTGWIIKLKVDDAAQLNGLMDFAAYQQFCDAEAH
jgi:glycine cleavage system H protein